uniref:Uncharacterized protein n=1 Tax=Chromera velia CCMP2878 TaxID=1169474 RepID=A0A0G4IB82_9ALVE|eukprot:Cvel_12785.t1-p1 / transcript=Cvel_12785.t1 / gene=Cvel_12785 / organism=Chromera_velia_CCMP2878 / gene_product=hypothetical protein / transcript_product=hypothetical protein / location=Cvel_scaffold851:2964-21150(-) / protein_length=2316 / sequence_SO=supercontig / SO=protein_coding / is_pseudo=false
MQKTDNILSPPGGDQILALDSDRKKEVGGQNADDFLLDLSFGESRQQFERVSLLGSSLSQAALLSIVLSLSKITFLDIRGNNLDAAFGWRLIKAMKRRYLQLEFCNGVDLKGIKTNVTTKLNLANFSNHCGLYGIEVVGAIFLAHFLRLNESVRELNFRRNDVQKDGAKALAQAIIGNPKSAIETVNGLGWHPRARTGLNFQDFRSNSVRVLQVSKRMLNDEDMVFLEEWLLRYDCVEELDVSRNCLGQEGLRKLARFVMHSKSLLKLDMNGLPMDLQDIALFIKALRANTSLRTLVMPCEAVGCGPLRAERTQVLDALADSLLQHPSLNLFGTTPIKLADFRARAGGTGAGGDPSGAPPDTMSTWTANRHLSGSTPKAEVALQLALLGLAAPQSCGCVTFGSGGTPGSGVYPSVSPYPLYLVPPLVDMISRMAEVLQKITLALPPGSSGLYPAMRSLASSRSLTHLVIAGYAHAKMAAEGAPANSLADVPPAPDGSFWGDGWANYFVLAQLVRGCPRLQSFNAVELGTNDEVDLRLLLAMECVRDVGCVVKERDVRGDSRTGTGGQGGGDLTAPLTSVAVSLGKEASVDLFYTIIRSHPRKLQVEVKFEGQNSRVFALQAERFSAQFAADVQHAASRSRVAVGGGGHEFCLRNRFDSLPLLRCLALQAGGGGPSISEIGVDRVEACDGLVLASLVSAFGGVVGGEHGGPVQSPLPPLRVLTVHRSLMNSRRIRKRWPSEVLQQMELLRSAFSQAPSFQVEVKFEGQNSRVFALQAERFSAQFAADVQHAASRSRVAVGGGGHEFCLRNRFDSLPLLRCLALQAGGGGPSISEIGVDRVEACDGLVLASLVSAFGGVVGGEHGGPVQSPLPPLRVLTVHRSLMNSRRIRKRWPSEVLQQMELLRSAFSQAPSFQGKQPEVSGANLEVSVSSGPSLFLHPEKDLQWMLPSGAASHLLVVNLAMANLREKVLSAHPDEFASTSELFWRSNFPDDSLDLPLLSVASKEPPLPLQALQEGGVVEGPSLEEALSRNINILPGQVSSGHFRFHWRHRFRIGDVQWRAQVAKLASFARGGLGGNEGKSGARGAEESPSSLLKGEGAGGTLESGESVAGANERRHAALFQEILTSLMELPALQTLDLRGNGMTKEDGLHLLGLLEANSSLRVLNGIPVMVDDARSCEFLDFDGAGLPSSPVGGDPAGGRAGGKGKNRRSTAGGRSGGFGGRGGGGRGGSQDFDDPEGHVYARSAIDCPAGIVRLDEGDAFLLGSLLTEANFPGLSRVRLARHAIGDEALPFVTDAILAMPAVRGLFLSDIRLSSRGVSLFVSALCEIAPRLESLNGLPVAAMLAASAPVPLPSEGRVEGAPGGMVEWNDFSLAVLQRLQLWHKIDARGSGDGGGGPLGESLDLPRGEVSDAGVRGVCALIGSPAGLYAPLPPQLTGAFSAAASVRHLNFSYSPFLTDSAVCELCRCIMALKSAAKPGGGGGGRGGTSGAPVALSTLNIRFCPRLRVRSAIELVRLAQTCGDAVRVINGVDLATLHLSGKLMESIVQNLQMTQNQQGYAKHPAHLHALSAVPPLLVRTSPTPSRMLTEGDAHFFAHLLHIFPHIPYLHIHIELPSLSQQRKAASTLPPDFHPDSQTSAPTHGDLPEHQQGFSAFAAIGGAAPQPDFCRPSGNHEHFRVAGRLLVAGAPVSPTPHFLHQGRSPRAQEAEERAATQTLIDRVAMAFSSCPATTKLKLSVGPYVSTAGICGGEGGGGAREGGDEGDEDGEGQVAGGGDEGPLPEDEYMELVYVRPTEEGTQEGNSGTDKGTPPPLLLRAAQVRRARAARRARWVSRYLEREGATGGVPPGRRRSSYGGSMSIEEEEMEAQRQAAAAAGRDSAVPEPSGASRRPVGRVSTSGDPKREARRRALHEEQLLRKRLYVNNINHQNDHNFWWSLHGVDGGDLLAGDVYRDVGRPFAWKACLPDGVSLAPLLSLTSSLDIQEVHMTAAHVALMAQEASDGSAAGREGISGSSGLAGPEIEAAVRSGFPLSMLSGGGLGPIAGLGLTHLCLNDNVLGDVGTVALVRVLAWFGASLVHLSLAGNGIADLGVRRLSGLIKKGGVPRLSSLDLSRNFVGESGAQALADALSGGRLAARERMRARTRKGVGKKLQIGDGEGGGGDQTTQLVEKLEEMEEEDEEIEMGGFPPSSPFLSVDLSTNRIRELGALAFAELLALSHAAPESQQPQPQEGELNLPPASFALSLQFLSVGSNEIGITSPHPALALAHAARRCMPLTVLNLSLNGVDWPSTLAQELPEFDPTDMQDGVFIRRPEMPL